MRKWQLNMIKFTQVRSGFLKGWSFVKIWDCARQMTCQTLTTAEISVVHTSNASPCQKASLMPNNIDLAGLWPNLDATRDSSRRTTMAPDVRDIEIGGKCYSLAMEFLQFVVSFECQNTSFCACHNPGCLVIWLYASKWSKVHNFRVKSK